MRNKPPWRGTTPYRRGTGDSRDRPREKQPPHVPLNHPKGKSHEQPCIDDLYMITKGGAKLFVPWKWFWPWKKYHGYIIPSDEAYRTLRRRQWLWLRLGQYGTLFVALFVSTRMHAVTGSLWVTVAVAVISFVLFGLAYYAWTYFQCLHLERSDEEY